VWLPDHHGQLSPVATMPATMPTTAVENTGVVIPLRRVG
jgi:hypothetical protein